MDDLTDKTISELQKQLNSPELLQPGWLQRSHVAYELVCYMNNLVALHAAGNAESIPLFVDRAKGYLQREDAALLNEDYRQLAREYLRLMEDRYGSL
jgi:hypothetical protein